MSDSFDAMMKEFTEDYQNAIDQQTKDDIHVKIIKYTSWFPNRARGCHKSISATIIPTGASQDTSDDTIKLEKRPNKRRLNFRTNIHPLPSNSDRFKRRCTSPANMDDSTAEGTIKLNTFSI
ncbi:unnamed protein product [Rhizophagus irregularis]|nr:unnamed protein product [Rhizophagus irregularis]